MQIVSTREFRANQKKYFDLADKEVVLVTRRNSRPIRISVVDEDDFLSAKEVAAILQGLEDVKSGNTTKIEDINNIWADILQLRINNILL